LIAAACLIAVALGFSGLYRNSSGALLDRAQACMERGRHADAAELYEQVLDRSPEAIDSMAAPYTQALQSLPVRYAERARAAVQRNALTENPRAWFFLGFVCGKLEDLAGAAAAYETVIQMDPRFAEGYFNLGHVYALQKKYPDAEKMFRKTVELAPPFVDEALYNLALVVDLQGRKHECARYLQEALRANPGNEKAQAYMHKVAKTVL
jgi:tetratricopeptide (TPR) repeat protein